MKKEEEEKVKSLPWILYEVQVVHQSLQKGIWKLMREDIVIHPFVLNEGGEKGGKEWASL